jgi:hypothetical protein
MELAAEQYVILAFTTAACLARVLGSYITRKQLASDSQNAQSFPPVYVLVIVSVIDVCASTGIVVCESVDRSPLWVAPCLSAVAVLHTWAWLTWLHPVSMSTKLVSLLAHVLSALSIQIAFIFMVQLMVVARTSYSAVATLSIAFVFWAVVLAFTASRVFFGMKKKHPTDASSVESDTETMTSAV